MGQCVIEASRVVSLRLTFSACYYLLLLLPPPLLLLPLLLLLLLPPPPPLLLLPPLLPLLQVTHPGPAFKLKLP